MKIIVAGATGYVGNLLFKYASQFSDVIGTSTLGTGDFVALDFSKPDKFDFEIINKGDVIILTAAISSPDVCSNNYNFAYSVNVTGTIFFIENAIARGAKVIFFSSDTVYGEKETKFDENGECNPVGEYGKMKHAVEAHFLGNPSFKTLRLSYIASKDDKFISYLLKCAQNGDEAEIFHPFYRSVIYRDDVIEGAVKIALDWPAVNSQIINFGGPETISRQDMALGFKALVSGNLKIKITEPNETFFVNRPRFINMESSILPKILGRNTRTINELYQLDFSTGV